MANWSPDGHVGQMFKIIGKHVPPPPLVAPPVKWGDEATVGARLHDGIAELKTTKRLYPMRYPFAPAEVVEFFRIYYGPTNRAFAALDPERQAALRSDIEAEYLEVVAIRA